MNNKDPAFLFYPSDFLTGTMFMSDEQVGKYIRLLCSQHQFGHLTEKHMKKICNSYDEDIYSKFDKDEEGLYFNHRLEEEINKRHKYCESRRNNRAGKTKDNKDKNNICKTHEKHMENVNVNINENKDININKDKDINININYETLFFEFWNTYTPVRCEGRVVDKGSKKLSFEKFVRTLKSGAKYEDIIAGTRAYIKSCQANNRYTLAVPTFLNQRRWADDYNTAAIDGEDPGRKQSEPRSLLEIYAEAAAEYKQADEIHRIRG